MGKARRKSDLGALLDDYTGAVAAICGRSDSSVLKFRFQLDPPLYPPKKCIHTSTKENSTFFNRLW